MKYLAVFAVILGCICYTAYAQACEQSVFNNCYDPYATCATRSNSTAERCACTSTYGACLDKNNCYGIGGTREQFMTECQQQGCTAQQCSGSVIYGINVALLLASLLVAMYH
eukprot:TRINITY_DN637_c0_g1_i1.p1 TRINITY_DN637_c0_g1~~TRINITY_DN637_c0_g1_i1.p1  ORF type:complete len:121 (-),score=8.28 TRINITY_DN637_c0_g1_i1:67-402(-)